MDTPLITILTPTYNRAAYISAAIESVLAQDYPNWELIIIDDASTDDTESIVRSYIEKEKGTMNGISRISYIRQPKNVGIARNRNAGLDKARGKYIAVLDSDDIWIDSHKLTKQISVFEKKDEKTPAAMVRPYGIVGTWVKKIDTEGKEIGDIRFAGDDRSIRKNILRRNQFAHSSVVFLRQAMLEAGGYDATYAIGDDYDLMLKIGQKYALANIAEYATGYRIHDDNITKSRRMQHVREHLAIIKRYKASYPCYLSALIKSYLRIIRAYF